MEENTPTPIITDLNPPTEIAQTEPIQPEKKSKKILTISLVLFVVAVALFTAWRLYIRTDDTTAPAMTAENTQTSQENTVTIEAPFLQTKNIPRATESSIDRYFVAKHNSGRLFLMASGKMSREIMPDETKSILQYDFEPTTGVLAFISIDECAEPNYIRNWCPANLHIMNVNQPETMNTYSSYIAEDGSTRGIGDFAVSPVTPALLMVSSYGASYIPLNEDLTLQKSTATFINPQPLTEPSYTGTNYVNPVFSKSGNYVLIARGYYEGADYAVIDLQNKTLKVVEGSFEYAEPEGSSVVQIPRFWWDNDQLVIYYCNTNIPCEKRLFDPSNFLVSPTRFSLDAPGLDAVYGSSEAYSVVPREEDRPNGGKNKFLDVVKTNDQGTRTTLVTFNADLYYCDGCSTAIGEYARIDSIELSEDEKTLFVLARFFYKDYFDKNEHQYHQFDSLLAIPVNDPEALYEIARLP
ncbi:MAG: hypothetical protein QG639_879 [Patescibacteria group bacterium]|nr:hypothetical protein [Patescibacteria group bacterium]